MIQLKKGENPFPTARSALLIIMATLLLVTTVGIIWDDLEAKWKMLLLESLIVIPTLIFAFVRGFSFRELFKWKKSSANVIFASGLIGVGFIPISDELDNLIQMIIPIPDEIMKALEKFLIVHSAEEYIVLILAGVLIASISEELLFRGFLLTTLERTMQPIKAIMISACLFAAVHFNPWWIITIWIAGFLMGLLAWRSRSIFPPMVVHGINNGFSLVFNNVGNNHLNGSYYMKGHVSPLWIVGGLICLAWGLRLLYRFTEQRHDNIIS